MGESCESVLLTKHKIIRPEELPWGPSFHRIHRPRLQIDQNRAGNVFAVWKKELSTTNLWRKKTCSPRKLRRRRRYTTEKKWNDLDKKMERLGYIFGTIGTNGPSTGTTGKAKVMVRTYRLHERNDDPGTSIFHLSRAIYFCRIRRR